MNSEPCNICGSKNLNLVDGYYYCAECGTQDVDVRETVVEHTILADGTCAFGDKRKVTKIAKKGIEMSSEWYKWHAFNFILCGLADELVKLGASPGFKMKVLWIWTRYMKKYQIKEDMQAGDKINGTLNSSKENEDVEEFSKDDKQNDEKKFLNDINILTKPKLIAILWVALNLDESDIQLSNLYKFIREGRISFLNCIKFVPKEINTNKIEHWKNFTAPGTNRMKCFVLRFYTMTLFKRLNLGSPRVPDVKKLVVNYLKELCLPEDFKHLVFSLMNLVPCNFLKLISKKNSHEITRTPDFEGSVMAYIIIALKLCFGLDDDYEINLSDTVEKINERENHVKSYKIGNNSVPTERLFSFREWCNYYQFRKSILCKYNFPIAQLYNTNTDDYVLFEQWRGRKCDRKIELRDEITMDILNKIPQFADVAVIPQSEFEPTLTPLSTYTEIISEYIQDPDLRLLLCEDFTKYSINYLYKDVKIMDPDTNENIIVGINDKHKTINKMIEGRFRSNVTDRTMVYVRNCENKHWLKTKPPTLDHISPIDENNDDIENNIDIENNCDQAYELSAKNIKENEGSLLDTGDEENTRELEVIEEEIEGYCIFDDDFVNIDEDEQKEGQEKTRMEFNMDISHIHEDNDIQDSKSDILDNISDIAATVALPEFNPDTFNRQATIKDLIMQACKKHKIPIPTEYKDIQPKGVVRKRRSCFLDETKHLEKKKKVNNGETKQDIEKIVSAYLSILQNDLLQIVSDQVRTAIQDHTENSQHCAYESMPNDTINNENDLISDQENAQDQENVEDINADVSDDLNRSDNPEQDTLDPLFDKSDPRFDDKLYDINQLYVKFKENVNISELFDLDPEIEKIITKKIEEIQTGNEKPIEEEQTELNIDSEEINKSIDECDSDEDVVLAALKRQKLLKKQKKDRKLLPPLVEKTEHIKSFQYWLRHYRSNRWYQSKTLSSAFELELMSNFSKSFTFVIRECASIIEATPFSIYKQLQYLEPLLMKT